MPPTCTLKRKWTCNILWHLSCIGTLCECPFVITGGYIHVSLTHMYHSHTCITHIHVSLTHTCITHTHMYHSHTHVSLTHTCITHTHVSLTHMYHSHTCITHIHVSLTHTCTYHTHVFVLDTDFNVLNRLNTIIVKSVLRDYMYMLWTTFRGSLQAGPIVWK